MGTYSVGTWVRAEPELTADEDVTQIFAAASWPATEKCVTEECNTIAPGIRCRGRRELCYI